MGGLSELTSGCISGVQSRRFSLREVNDEEFGCWISHLSKDVVSSGRISSSSSHLSTFILPSYLLTFAVGRMSGPLPRT